MSIQDQARQLNINNRNHNKQRLDSMLARAANQVGLTVKEVTKNNWQD